MSEIDKKTLRHFYCRDALWQGFEAMSEELDHGIDDLVNEAMAFYAREKGYLPTDNQLPGGVHGRATPPRLMAATPQAPAPAWSPAAAPPTFPPRAPTPPPLPPPRASAVRPAVPSQRPPVPPQFAGSPPAYSPGGGPPPLAAAHVETPAPPLYLVFDNRKYRIDKDQFIIGRGVKSSDLPIRDGNISRKHAAVVRRNGAYYIKDLGSTNGIDFNGMRVDNKRIEEGDVYHLCEYPLRFTFQ